MILSDSGESLLLVEFREFYREVIALKESVAMATVDADGEEPAQSAIWNRLVELLDQQQRAAIQLGSEYLSFYEEARYVMVALADEIFLHLDWEGRASWHFNLLESHLFQSHVAGERFFQKIERLLEKRTPDRIELAKIYLMAIALGFQGKYRGVGGAAWLDNYRARLYAYIVHSDVVIHSEQERPLFPAAYDHTIGEGDQVKKLPSVQLWLAVLGGVVVVGGGISFLIWRVLMSDLRELLAQLLK